MSMSRVPATLLREDGNRHFQRGDYVSAEALYSKAIIADPRNPTLYTNRAMARLKMGLWESVIADCNDCLELTPDSMKAHYQLSQAYLSLHDFSSALEHALRAHELCVQTNDKSLGAVTAQVLRCKKDRWDDMERRRRREGAELESEVVAMMERERDEALRDSAADPDLGLDEGGRREIHAEWAQKITKMRQIFERARPAEDKHRAVPDWAIDDISFGIMVDPVVTRTGKSYERASIMEHLRKHPTDPITREPLLISELRPNLDLRQACQEFLDENGWAVDW